MRFHRNQATQTGITFRATVLVLALALPPVTAALSPALSQAVQLVKVDVAVVDKGLRASKLIGESVSNDKNEKVGSIDDIIVGSDHSLYAVLQVGGFLGIGKKLVAVPYDSLQIDEKDGKIAKVELPGASSDQLKQLAEFRYRT